MEQKKRTEAIATILSLAMVFTFIPLQVTPITPHLQRQLHSQSK